MPWQGVSSGDPTAAPCFVCIPAGAQHLEIWPEVRAAQPLRPAKHRLLRSAKHRPLRSASRDTAAGGTGRDGDHQGRNHTLGGLWGPQGPNCQGKTRGQVQAHCPHLPSFNQGTLAVTPYILTSYIRYYINVENFPPKISDLETLT